MTQVLASPPGPAAGRAWIKHARLAFAVILAGGGLALVPEGIRLGFMISSRDGTASPGPGFFPVIVGSALLVGAIGWGGVERRGALGDQVPQDLDRAGPIRLGRILAALIALYFAFEPIGYNLSVLAFMLFTTFTMGKGRWWLNVIVSLGASFGIYLLFERALGVMLPDSILPFMARLGL